VDSMSEGAWLHAIASVLDRSHLWQPDQVAETVGRTLSDLGISSSIYLIDIEQRMLRPLAPPGPPPPAAIPVDGTLPGRAFTTVKSILSGGTGEAATWWVPMVNGTDRMGVIEYTVKPGVDPRAPGFAECCASFAGLIGHLITISVRRGDAIDHARRSRPMSVASELMWQLLPPLTASIDGLAISAIMEPCYDIGGDGYDYALDGRVITVAIFDGVGRGLKAGLATAVAISAIRAARRDGHGIYAQARAADAALLEQFADARFVTAILAELHLDTGTLRYLNAGHPPALLIRAGRVVQTLTAGRRMPLGLDEASIEIGEHALQPDDRLLLYTDGIIEARNDAGHLFGTDRLVALLDDHLGAGLPIAETLRRLAQAVAEYRGRGDADDATLLLAEWSRTAADRDVP
jgi:phosphoserine phosphatase RsbU/P